MTSILKIFEIIKWIYYFIIIVFERVVTVSVTAKGMFTTGQ